jgi:CheY-like chemotaxis protein
MIDRQVRRLMRLVDDLLDVSRITQGKIQLRRERAELRGIVNRAVETARPFIDSRKHELSVSLPAEAIWLDADPARLEQVVVNLLNNAAKYTEPGGHIWLTVEREGPEAVLRVTDTGIGIQAEMLPRVFDLFVQADGSLARAQGGLGVGLTLVKRLVEMHGGRVIAQSEGVGRGSEFSVRLPTLPEITALPSEAVPKRPQEVGTPLRVLVVDDNVDTAESLAMLLRRYGHDVEVAHTGPTALRLAQEHPPDVVLLDIGLPGMDGLQVAHKLRQQERMENVRLIATTGYGSDCDRQHCHDAGFDYHLLKPVDFAKLQELLGELGKQLHKE